MTENTCGSWGAGAVGFVLGAALTNGGGLFGNGGCAKQCGCPNPEIAAIDAKVTDLENWNQSREILGAITAGNENTLDVLNQINRDNYALGVQGIYNQQTVARNIDKEFCNTNGIIVADGEKTRGAIAAFQTRYLEDRIHDRDLTIAKLQNELVAAPLACGLAAVNAKLDSVIGCAGVKTCGSACGSNPYTIPPLVGTATNTQSYNPSIPAA
jgi:hypothetical protein